MNKQELLTHLQSLRDHERGINPDPAWIVRQRETLLMQVKNSMPIRDSLFKRYKTATRHLLPEQWSTYLRGPMLAILSLIGVVTGGSIMSVSAAERALPGDFLYTIKLASEQTRIMFTKRKTEKVRLKASFVERRANEIKELAATDTPERQERLHEATEILKRDLDTVKTQLNEAAGEDPAHDVAAVAKVVDDTSVELGKTLKGVRILLPQEDKNSISEAEVAAVSTGVKAVQVLIESQDKSDIKNQVASNDQLIESIQNKVQGLEEHVTDAAHKLRDASSTTVGDAGNATSSPISAADTSSTNRQIVSARESLQATRQLLGENKIQEARDRLGEVTQVVTNVEKTVSALPALAASTSTVAVPTNMTSTSPLRGENTLTANASSTGHPR